MKFKVGDKIKVICNDTKSSIVGYAMNKTGTISSIGGGMIHVQFNENIYQGLTVIGFFEREIEKVAVKGQQLLFSFMSEVT